jgi:molybdopterin converting factor small subunit
MRMEKFPMGGNKGSINVKVVLRAGLKKYEKEVGESLVSLEQGATLDDLVKNLEMSDEDVWVVGINGVLAHGESNLEDNDTVEFFEPVAGG